MLKNMSLAVKIALRRWTTDGYIVRAFTVQILNGKDHEIKHVLRGPSIVIPFAINERSFVVDVCLG